MDLYGLINQRLCCNIIIRFTSKTQLMLRMLIAKASPNYACKESFAKVKLIGGFTYEL
jgi:hypothetical protein